MAVEFAAAGHCCRIFNRCIGVACDLREDMTMPRLILATVFLAVMMPNTSVLALTAQEKMTTCRFGADDQKLKGAKRKTFLSRCMANESAPARKVTMKKKKTMQPPPAPAPPPPKT
jgi:hypothetical protein